MRKISILFFFVCISAQAFSAIQGLSWGTPKKIALQKMKAKGYSPTTREKTIYGEVVFYLYTIAGSKFKLSLNFVKGKLRSCQLACYDPHMSQKFFLAVANLAVKKKNVKHAKTRMVKGSDRIVVKTYSNKAYKVVIRYSTKNKTGLFNTIEYFDNVFDKNWDTYRNKIIQERL